MTTQAAWFTERGLSIARRRSNDPLAMADLIRAVLRAATPEELSFYGATPEQRLAFARRHYSQAIEVLNPFVVAAAAHPGDGCKWCWASLLAKQAKCHPPLVTEARKILLGYPCPRHEAKRPQPAAVTGRNGHAQSGFYSVGHDARDCDPVRGCACGRYDGPPEPRRSR